MTNLKQSGQQSRDNVQCTEEILSSSKIDLGGTESQPVSEQGRNSGVHNHQREQSNQQRTFQSSSSKHLIILL